MNKIRYSNGTRLIAFILQEILVISATIAAIFLGNANISTDYFKDAIEGKSYIESQYFSDQLITNINNASWFMKAQQDFEVDGEYNGNKEVSLSQFLNDDSNVSQYSTQQLYKLQDLIDWSQVGVEYTILSEALENRMISSIKDKNIEYASLAADDLPTTDADVVTDAEVIIQEGNTVTTEQALFTDLKIMGINITEELLETSIVKENYVSTTGMTLLGDALNKNDFTEIEKTSAELQEALTNMNEEYNFYKNNETYYKSIDSTNFKIYIQDNKGNALLNNCIVDNTNYEDYFKNNVSGGIIYNALNNEFTFTDSINDDAYANVSSFKIRDQVNYIYAVGIDKNFTHDDGFLQGHEAYNNSKISIIVLIAGMLGILICFIYLVAVCGKNSRDEELHLNVFDKIKTEIGATIMVVLAIVVIFIIDAVITTISSNIAVVVWIGVETTLFTIGFLSLTRRIKAGEIWKNSLCYLGIKWITLFFKYRKVTTKMAIIYSAYTLITLGLLGIAMNSGSFFTLFLWLIFAGGVGVMLLREAIARQTILNGIEKITGGELDYKIDTATLKGSNAELANAINNIGEGLHNAVDASMRNERLKTDLITNVSHDIKTPLTSIINYVDLIRREDIDNEKIKGYIEILDNKSQRLKNLTEDLVEASKISSGNIKLEITRINFVELINQTEGEFSEKFAAKGLLVVKTLPNEPVSIQADGRRIWRVVENLYNNVAKYAMENTRVYVDVKAYEEKVEFSIKNISENPLNINADELTERFIRGDVSRSTEGSGLGLSIAKNLTTLQNGTFEIYLDGDLFRVTIRFPRV